MSEQAAPLTFHDIERLSEEELGRIATQHDQGPNRECVTCKTEPYFGEVQHALWPCDAARLYALVLKQSALMAEWGLPCSCDADFDLE